MPASAVPAASLSVSDEKISIDLNDLFPVKSSPAMVQEKVAQWDVSAYKDKNIQISGCSPTWAHLIVAGKLFGTASAVEFLMDDGKDGVAIPIFRRSN